MHFFDLMGTNDIQGPHLGLCTARLGLEAPALAWLEAALALSNLRPGQSRQSQLGSGLAWAQAAAFVSNCIVYIFIIKIII